MTCLFVLIGSEFVDTNTCSQTWLQIVYGPHPNWTYIFYSPAGMRKVNEMVPVGCNLLLTSIDFFVDIKHPLSYSHKTSFVECWIVYFEFTGSAFIDPKTFPRVWLKFFCGLYPNWAYRFDSPTGSWKVVVRVPVVWLHL